MNQNSDNNYSIIGPLFIVLCMLFRASDIFFRKSVIEALSSPMVIILTEHILGFLLLSPILIKTLPELKTFKYQDWLALAFVSMGGSVLGIYCFTKAFSLMNPALAIILQKLQPIFTILLARFYLKEKLSKSFFIWAFGGILCAALISIGGDFKFDTIKQGGVFYAIGAAFFWGCATVFGKHLISHFTFVETTALRYGFGTPFAVLIFLLSSISYPFDKIAESANLLKLAYMAYIPGLFALLLFYKGLKTTKANIASICELFYPLASVIIMWVFFNQGLDMLQITAAIGLFIAITQVSRQNR